MRAGRLPPLLVLALALSGTAARADDLSFGRTFPAFDSPEAANTMIEVLGKAWQKDRKDYEACMMLGYAYTARAGITPLSRLEARLGDIDRALRLFGRVAAHLPRNMDARLARTMVTMKNSAQAGRPDALILEDSSVYLEGFSMLSPELQAARYYRAGAEVMRLAEALVRADQGKKAAARNLVLAIDPAVLPLEFMKPYSSLKNRLRAVQGELRK